jgi:hypothetical protein
VVAVCVCCQGQEPRVHCHCHVILQFCLNIFEYFQIQNSNRLRIVRTTGRAHGALWQEKIKSFQIFKNAIESERYGSRDTSELIVVIGEYSGTVASVIWNLLQSTIKATLCIFISASSFSYGTMHRTVLDAIRQKKKGCESTELF